MLLNGYLLVDCCLSAVASVCLRSLLSIGWDVCLQIDNNHLDMISEFTEKKKTSKNTEWSGNFLVRLKFSLITLIQLQMLPRCCLLMSIFTHPLRSIQFLSLTFYLKLLAKIKVNCLRAAREESHADLKATFNPVIYVFEVHLVRIDQKGSIWPHYMYQYALIRIQQSYVYIFFRNVGKVDPYMGSFSVNMR